uniref:Uncharacterized protein n=1 Tax=Rhodnius prolixus TaxID=13249 RepID=T1IDH2_RHOPR
MSATDSKHMMSMVEGRYGLKSGSSCWLNTVAETIDTSDDCDIEEPYINMVFTRIIIINILSTAAKSCDNMPVGIHHEPPGAPEEF